MAHFYGTVTGNRGTASRTSPTKGKGMFSAVSSPGFAVNTWLRDYHGEERLRVEIKDWNSGKTITLYDGPTAALKSADPA